jgi:hypothetical protein
VSRGAAIDLNNKVYQGGDRVSIEPNLLQSVPIGQATIGCKHPALLGYTKQIAFRGAKPSSPLALLYLDRLRDRDMAQEDSHEIQLFSL